MNKIQVVNTRALFVAQVFGMTNNVAFVFLGAIVAIKLINNASLATLPYALSVIGTALAAHPAGYLMVKFGRKKCFLYSAIFNSLAILMTVYSITHRNYILFCVGAFIVGANRYFLMQYRFAVTDGITSQLAPKVVSIILLANIFSAFLGTFISVFTKNLFSVIYAGSFFALFFLSLGTIIALCFYKDLIKDKHVETILQPSKRTTNFIPIVILSAGSYFIMSLIMVSTPLQMKINSDYSMDVIGIVMQWHFVAMYLPSLFFNTLSRKIGQYNIIWLGIFLFFLSMLINFTGTSIYQYLLSLILLGLAWNLCFTGSTIILQETQAGNRMLKIQTINDFYVFACNAVACLLAGKLIMSIGWNGINIVSVIVCIIMCFGLFIIHYNKKNGIVSKN